MFVTGIVNMFIAKDGKSIEDPVHSVWKHFFELKFALSLLLTPIIYPLTVPFAEEGSNFISEETKTSIQFWVVMFLCLFSPFTKWYREEICLNFSHDAVILKCK